MCGIIGVIGKGTTHVIKKDMTGFLSDAIVVGTVRGTDATGLLQIEDGYPFIHKAPVNGVYFHDMGMTQSWINHLDTATFSLIHHRSATSGDNNYDNAHPFQFDRDDGTCIVGVHNGVLNNWKAEKHDFEVDSQWALNKIAKEGVQALGEFSGAFVFVWYDTRDHKVYIASNGQRNISYIPGKDNDLMFIGSEFQMTHWLASRSNRFTLGEGKVLAPNTYIVIDPKNPREVTSHTIPFPKSHSPTVAERATASTSPGTPAVSSLNNPPLVNHMTGSVLTLPPTNKERRKKTDAFGRTTGETTRSQPNLVLVRPGWVTGIEIATATRLGVKDHAARFRITGFDAKEKLLMGFASLMRDEKDGTQQEFPAKIRDIDLLTRDDLLKFREGDLVLALIRGVSKPTDMSEPTYILDFPFMFNRNEARKGNIDGHTTVQ